VQFLVILSHEPVSYWIQLLQYPGHSTWVLEWAPKWCFVKPNALIVRGMNTLLMPDKLMFIYSDLRGLMYFNSWWWNKPWFSEAYDLHRLSGAGPSVFCPAAGSICQCQCCSVPCWLLWRKLRRGRRQGKTRPQVPKFGDTEYVGLVAADFTSTNSMAEWKYQVWELSPWYWNIMEKYL